MASSALCLILAIHANLRAQSKVEFYASRTVDLRGDSLRSFIPHLKDTIAWDTLYQVRAATGLPVSYFRRIQTPVCFDNKCRMLNVIVHWNITGRYLGFELPMGEYFSKAEHEPFVFTEYERMHTILGDPFSPLSGIAYNELVPASNTIPAEVDAVSSPTANNLLEFVVVGAAFTTYKLWHIVYGPTRDEVSRCTERELSTELWLQVVNSSDVTDRLWALERRAALKQSSGDIRQLLLNSITDPQYNVASSAIAAISKADLRTADFQIAFLKTLDNVNYGLKKSIITKLAEAPQLAPKTIDILGEGLDRLSAELIGSVLKVLVEKQVQNDKINQRVGKLLQSPNSFVSRQAYDFFQSLAIKDREILKKISEYEEKHSLR